MGLQAGATTVGNGHVGEERGGRSSQEWGWDTEGFRNGLYPLFTDERKRVKGQRTVTEDNLLGLSYSTFPKTLYIKSPKVGSPLIFPSD